MKMAHFTVRIIKPNPHREGTQTWRAGQIATGMEGCQVKSIIRALRAFEEETREMGVVDPARWLLHFAGLASMQSRKKMEPWIEILHDGEVVRSVANYRELLKSENI